VFGIACSYVDAKGKALPCIFKIRRTAQEIVLFLSETIESYLKIAGAFLFSMTKADGTFRFIVSLRQISRAQFLRYEEKGRSRYR